MAKDIYSTPADGSIPEFLKRLPNGDLKHKARASKAVSAVKKVETPETPPADDLEFIEDLEKREMVRRELRAGRLRRHWFEDPKCLAMFFYEVRSKEEVREARNEAKRTETAVKKAFQPPFGIGIRIVIVVEEPKRKEGSARVVTWAEMKAFIKKNPNASVADVIANTKYTKGDFNRDHRLKLIKTDLVKSDKPATPVEIKAKPKKGAKK